MRCKVGDLAAIVKNEYSQNIGALVTILAPSQHFAGYWHVETLSRVLCADIYADGSSREYWAPAGKQAEIADTDLRPLRDGDGVDETLRELEHVV